jgi:preprotein translocase SecE subunit
MNAIVQYINECVEELHHVRWPTQQQAIRFSGVVLTFTFVCAFVFGLLDFGLSELIQKLLTIS